MGQTADDARTTEVADRAYTRITWRLVPILFACYVAAYLDRVNVGFAKLQMLRELHWSAAIYGLGAGMFFIGYFLFEVPSNIILYRVGARRWIARVMLSWAVVSALTMFARTPIAFYVLRFLLGLAEAGLFPGILLYLTYWYPSERRGQIIALFMTGIPIAGLIGSPVSGAILDVFSGMRGLSGWQWLYLIEAIPSVVMAVVVLFCLDDRVTEARWLSEAEKEVVQAAVAADARGAQAHTLRDGFTDRRVWFLSFLYLFFIMGLYGVGFWLPTLIRGAGVADPFRIGGLTAIPYAVAAVAMVLVGRSSDRARERRWHLALPGAVGTIGWLASLVFSHDLVVAEIALTVATVGVLVALAQFWCLPTAILAGAAAASGIAVVNSCGNLAGFAGPALIGGIISRTGSIDLGVLVLAASLLVGSLLVLTLPRSVNR